MPQFLKKCFSIVFFCTKIPFSIVENPLVSLFLSSLKEAISAVRYHCLSCVHKFSPWRSPGKSSCRFLDSSLYATLYFLGSTLQIPCASEPETHVSASSAQRHFFLLGLRHGLPIKSAHIHRQNTFPLETTLTLTYLWPNAQKLLAPILCFFLYLFTLRTVAPGSGGEGWWVDKSETNMDGNLVSNFKLMFILGQLQLCIISRQIFKRANIN